MITCLFGFSTEVIAFRCYGGVHFGLRGQQDAKHTRNGLPGVIFSPEDY
jgi:hypothetical protein